MRYTPQIQRDEIREAVRARYAMVIPIITGMLNATKTSILDQAGGREKITLELFARLYIERAADYGICFEYAVHQAIRERDNNIYPIISSVLEDFCNIRGDAESILFGIEKNGSANIIETAKNSLTDDARVLVGKIGQPPFLKPRLDQIAKAFYSEEQRGSLPESIRGLWKADLFLGSPAAERWVGATLKTNRAQFESAPGLRVGLYPEERRGESPSHDSGKNLIMCPLPYGGQFMQLFGASFQIVKQIVASKGKEPSRAALVYDDDMTVAKWLTDRAHLPIREILEALEPLKQPEFLDEGTADIVTLETDDEIHEATAPIPVIVV